MNIYDEYDRAADLSEYLCLDSKRYDGEIGAENEG